MANKITNTDYYSAIANAIRRKNGETDTYTPAEMADAIGRIPKGGGGASENDVNFYDYDGSIVASYTAAQFAALGEMPENPDHTDEGLTSQGWNWSLADAKAYVAKYGKLNVGQMYVPTDGKTHVFINIPAGDPSYETTLYFGHTTASGRTVIDWGDGSPTETYSGTSAAQHSHIYENSGNYEITLDTTNGIMNISGTGSQFNDIHFSGDGNYARGHSRIELMFLSSITAIESYAFAFCIKLKGVTIPNSMTNIGDYAFSNCTALKSVTLSNSATNIGDYAFYNCTALKSVTLSNSVIRIGLNAFRICGKLQSITIPDSVTNIGNYTFGSCTNLKSVTIPDSISSIPISMFYLCYGIQEVTIPDSVTYIGASSFFRCSFLESITIPEHVSSIGNTAFSSCHSISCIYFKIESPPIISNINVFEDIPADTVFYVPANSLNAYKTATNWSTYADRMVAEPE